MADEKLKTTAFDEPANIGLQNIATAYAKALFAAADKADALEPVVQDLEALVDQGIAKHQKIADVLASGMFSPEHKVEMISRAFTGKIHPLVLNLLKVLALHERSYIVRSVREEFRRIYDKRRGLVQVKVVSAVSLSSSQQATIAARMKSVLGGEPILRNEVDPNIIGGLIVQVGDVVFDGSLSSNLNRLREQLINRSVHEIQRRRDRVSTTS